MSGLIGKKIGMTSLYDEAGKLQSCTVIEMGPCTVTQVKTEDKDGYDALQLGFGEKKEKSTSSALKGHFKKAKTTPKSKIIEFQDFEKDFNLGDEITIEDVFNEGEFVDVSGSSKGKGFQGVVKRYNFGGVGQATHGQHNRLRAPGAIGACSTPSRVFKGMRMAGRMGNKRVTVQNLKVLRILSDKNIIVVNGSVPGAKNSTLVVQK